MTPEGPKLTPIGVDMQTIEVEKEKTVEGRLPFNMSAIFSCFYIQIPHSQFDFLTREQNLSGLNVTKNAFWRMQ